MGGPGCLARWCPKNSCRCRPSCHRFGALLPSASVPEPSWPLACSNMELPTRNRAPEPQASRRRSYAVVTVEFAVPRRCRELDGPQDHIKAVWLLDQADRRIPGTMRPGRFGPNKEADVPWRARLPYLSQIRLPSCEEHRSTRLLAQPYLAGRSRRGSSASGFWAFTSPPSRKAPTEKRLSGS
jgi:hypothetical protein